MSVFIHSYDEYQFNCIVSIIIIAYISMPTHSTSISSRECKKLGIGKRAIINKCKCIAEAQQYTRLQKRTFSKLCQNFTLPHKPRKQRFDDDDSTLSERKSSLQSLDCAECYRLVWADRNRIVLEEASKQTKPKKHAKQSLFEFTPAKCPPSQLPILSQSASVLTPSFRIVDEESPRADSGSEYEVV